MRRKKSRGARNLVTKGVSGSQRSQIASPRLDLSPEAPGLDAIIRGLGLVTPDDQKLLTFTHRLYDGLYAWVQRTV